MAPPIAFAAVMSTPVPASPNAVTAPMMTRKIRAQIKPYSMAVAPRWSRISRVRNVFSLASLIVSDHSRSHSQATSGSSAGGMG